VVLSSEKRNLFPKNKGAYPKRALLNLKYRMISSLIILDNVAHPVGKLFTSNSLCRPEDIFSRPPKVALPCQKLIYLRNPKEVTHFQINPENAHIATRPLFRPEVASQIQSTFFLGHQTFFQENCTSSKSQQFHLTMVTHPMRKDYRPKPRDPIVPSYCP